MDHPVEGSAPLLDHTTPWIADDDVGFIHGSFADQLAEVAQLVFADEPAELVVLDIDPDALAEAGVPVRVEDLDGTGTAYPHIYGAVPTVAVVRVQHAGFGEAGDFTIGEPVHAAY